jgi:hypothetical protein
MDPQRFQLGVLGTGGTTLRAPWLADLGRPFVGADADGDHRTPDEDGYILTLRPRPHRRLS